MKKKLSLCIDIGGTHLSAAVIDIESMTLYNNASVHTAVDSMGSQDSILKEWDSAIGEVLDICVDSVDSICISIPGPFDYDSGISLMDGMHKYQSLLHMDVKAWFAQKYNINPAHIYFFNDAAAFLLGELFHHKLFDKRVVGLTLGTGLGSALYEGKVLDLNYGSAKYRQGIAEDYISTRGLLDFVSQEYNKIYSNVKDIVDDIEAKEICAATFFYLADSLADFVHVHIDALKPDYIIIGGSISKAKALFLDRLQAQVEIPILMASLDEFNIFCGMASIKH